MFRVLRSYLDLACRWIISFGYHDAVRIPVDFTDVHLDVLVLERFQIVFAVALFPTLLVPDAVPLQTR